LVSTVNVGLKNGSTQPGVTAPRVMSSHRGASSRMDATPLLPKSAVASTESLASTVAVIDQSRSICSFPVPSQRVTTVPHMLR
jgi:hypothetical protein